MFSKMNERVKANRQFRRFSLPFQSLPAIKEKNPDTVGSPPG
jgi:hypothetical protein